MTAYMGTHINAHAHTCIDTHTGRRTPPHRFVYNCLLRLCGVHGRIYDGLDLLAAMRTDGAVQEDCRPDGYTYRWGVARMRDDGWGGAGGLQA